MTISSDITMIMVDDNVDEIFLARRQMRRLGIVNNFVLERRPERLMQTLGEMVEHGEDPSNLLMLLDVKMPRHDGFQTLKALRKDFRFKDISIIMLSASDSQSDMSIARALGANGYMVKPFRADEFFAALTDVSNVRCRLVQ